MNINLKKTDKQETENEEILQMQPERANEQKKKKSKNINYLFINLILTIMKKSLFFVAAASALMLTACSSENDVVQNAPQTQENVAKALDFDVYMPEAVTRAGLPEGVMTTDKLKTPGKGFGVFAFYHDAATYPANNTSLKPNFMFNEQIHWASGWTYSPLKYWPNETIQDSQSSNATTPGTYTDAENYTCDRLSFFAYAPYVNLTTNGADAMNIDRGTPTTIDAYIGSPAETSGILSISKDDRQGDPLVEWKYTADLDNNVDLLWGVAPAGMAYQSVNPDIYINKTVGKPLTDMVKPDKDQKMKFLFQHALSRIGLSVVSAIDQIAAGDDGNKFNKEQTRVLIDEVTIWGDFGLQGVLNLNNPTANVANWIDASVAKSTSDAGSPLFTINSTNGYLSPDLRYKATDITAIAGDHTKFADLNTGVLPSEQVLMLGGPDPSKKLTEDQPTYAFGKVLYKFDDPDYVIAKVASIAATGGAFTKNGNGDYTQVCDNGETVQLDGTTQYYTVVFSDEKTASIDNIAVDAEYYTRTGSAGSYVYTYHKNSGPGAVAITDGTKYFTFTSETVLAASGKYASDTYWSALMPRYFMVIPSQLSPSEAPTNISVKITYHVVTKDTKLNTNTTDVANTVTKSTSIQLRSGKSYNLKLILGLTSVKLDATVADWQIADDAEVWLPKNVE